MKRLITLLIILGFAVFIGITIAKDPGYMLLAYKHWTLETPLWLGIILWFIFACFIILIANIWQSFSNIAKRWHAWRSRKKLTRSNNLTVRSLLECIEGYFESAEKNVLKALPYAEIPLIDYLIAAYCANQLGKSELRNKYLLEAKTLIPEAEIALHLLKIEWLIQANDLIQAQNEVELLLTEDPHQNRALILAQNLYQKSGSWDDLLKISQTLRKRKMIDQDYYETLQSKAYAAKIITAKKSNDVKILNTCWLAIPSTYQNLPELTLVYSQALIQLQQGVQAEELLRSCLKKYWDDDIIYQYGLAVTPDTEQQLKQAEKWLTEHNHDAQLFLTLGRLAARASSWEKAKNYLENSLKIEENPEVYQLLAELAQGHADYNQANIYYEKGLKLALANYRSSSAG